jgi:hypothetical protein
MLRQICAGTAADQTAGDAAGGRAAPDWPMRGWTAGALSSKLDYSSRANTIRSTG